MMSQYALLTLLIPFLASVAVSLTGLINRKWCHSMCVGAMLLSLVAAIQTLLTVAANPGHPIHYTLGGWPAPIGIEFVIDEINAAVLVMIAAVALLSAISAKSTVQEELTERGPFFYTLFLMLVTGTMGMTVTGDAFNLYVFLEVASLSSYALIAMGSARAALACFRYIITGTIGASFYLLGVGYLYIKTGTLNMRDISTILAEQGLYQSSTIQTGFLFILIGLWVKMAFFPLHRWLPNAYTFAPTASSNLLAPLMTKVSVYVMIRFMYTIMTPAFTFAEPFRGRLVVWLAVCAILIGSFFALSRRKLKAMLGYLIIIEVGYMVGGAWLANERGLTGALFHILADGLMTFCLFLFAGIVFHRLKDYDITALDGIFKRMPWATVGFTLAALSMVGIPPT